MSKAFDTVQHSVLFQKLLDQGMPPIIVRYILMTSCKRLTSSGQTIRQISSQSEMGSSKEQFFLRCSTVYIHTNGLFEELRRLNIGCCVGENYVGIIGYADDLFLMAPSLDGLQIIRATGMRIL